MTDIVQHQYEGIDCIKVENDKVSFTILPEVGGKMISLFCKQNKREYLFRSPRKVSKPTYEQSYADLDISGFDECIPAIAPGFYPEWPWKGTIIPDHGEVFTLPWDYRILGDTLEISIFGVRFPYKLTKRLTLDANVVKINYELENLCACDFKYLWSAHCMLAAEEGQKIYLPGNPRIRTDFSLNERFGKHLYETDWPNAKQTDGKTVDLSIVRSPDSKAATKIFTTALDDGWCGLQNPSTGGYLKMSFDSGKTPFVGLWINEGGVFKEGENYHVALEPCNGCPDKLETAIQRGECAVLKGYSKTNWHLNIETGKSQKTIGTIVNR